jgi:cytochrome c-type biogenesis protein CcmH/NrfG
MFQLNVELHPDSSNTYDSLGEAYMANGEKELAIKNYEKSLELNANNGNAVEMLKKMKAE